MKLNPKASIILLLPYIIWSCQTYKPIEKVTFPSDPQLSRSENIAKQLKSLNEGDQISITMSNKSTHDLIFYNVVNDTLNAKLQKAKASAPLKIPIDRIEKVRVERVNLPLTLILSGLLIGVSTLVAVSSMNFSGFRPW